MIEKRHQAMVLVDPIAECDRFTKQDAATQFFSVQAACCFKAVMHGAAERKSSEEIIKEVPLPGEPEISLAGIAGRIVGGTKMWPWRP